MQTTGAVSHRRYDFFKDERNDIKFENMTPEQRTEKISQIKQKLKEKIQEIVKKQIFEAIESGNWQTINCEGEKNNFRITFIISVKDGENYLPVDKIRELIKEKKLFYSTLSQLGDRFIFNFFDAVTSKPFPGKDEYFELLSTALLDEVTENQKILDQFFSTYDLVSQIGSLSNEDYNIQKIDTDLIPWFKRKINYEVFDLHICSKIGACKLPLVNSSKNTKEKIKISEHLKNIQILLEKNIKEGCFFKTEYDCVREKYARLVIEAIEKSVLTENMREFNFAFLQTPCF